MCSPTDQGAAGRFTHIAKWVGQGAGITNSHEGSTSEAGRHTSAGVAAVSSADDGVHGAPPVPARRAGRSRHLHGAPSRLTRSWHSAWPMCGMPTSPEGLRPWAATCHLRSFTRCSTTSPTARSPATFLVCGRRSLHRPPAPRANRAPLLPCGGSSAPSPIPPASPVLPTWSPTLGPAPRTEGRALFAAVRTLPVPTEPVARLWHGANLLREHRGDGHVAALLTMGIGGTEAHVLHALSEGIPAEQFGRVSHLPQAQLAAVVDGMRVRDLIGADGWLTASGRQDQGTSRNAHRPARRPRLRRSRAGRTRSTHRGSRASRRGPRRCRFAVDRRLPLGGDLGEQGVDLGHAGLHAFDHAQGECLLHPIE